MRIFRTATCILLTLFLSGCVGKIHNERTIKSPSRLDLPDRGLYYGFIINNSSHFVEVDILSIEQNSQILRKIELPPARSSINKNRKSARFGDYNKYANRPPNVTSLWLKLNRYKISIRNRDDLINEGPPGPWKTFIGVLDKEYVEKSPGPFSLEIE